MNLSRLLAIVIHVKEYACMHTQTNTRTHIRCVSTVGDWIRVHPVGRSNELITIILHIYMCAYVCYYMYIWQCVCARARKTGAAGNAIFTQHRNNYILPTFFFIVTACCTSNITSRPK